ncbi:MAG: amino acid permease, partial [Acidipropionibacterium jensenii]|nr:amino acid permease [Acidipropionibacterium jensenii]
VLEHAVGPWGRWFVSIGLIVSVLGAYLAWSLMAAEVLSVMAESQDMPRFLARTNRNGVPENAVLLSSLLVQLLLVILLFASNALDLALDLTSALTLIPFFLAALFALKLVLSRNGGTEKNTGKNTLVPRDIMLAILACLYTAFLIFAAGLQFLLLSFVIYAPASILFVMTRREQGRTLFTAREFVILMVSLIGAAAGIVALATGFTQL